MESTQTPIQTSKKGLFTSIISLLILAAAFIGISTIKTQDKTQIEDEAPTTSPEPETVPQAPTPATTPTSTTTTKNTTRIYRDGTYTAQGAYGSPAGAESIGLRLTLKNDIVTDVLVTPMATNIKSVQYQGKFISGIKAEVVGKNIDSLRVDVVSGSSLTPDGFNDALIKIKAEAHI